MLKISKEQMEVFEQASLQSYEDRMVEHLRNFAPRHFKILTEDEIRQVIRHGMERGRSQRFTSERSLRIYTELMLMLGSGFDADPQLPWAAEMLNDEAVVDEAARINRLQQKAGDYVEQVVPDFGDVEGAVDPGRFVEQIRQLRQEREDSLDAAAVPQFYQRAVMRLNLTFPRKCEYIGELSLRRLINRAIECAKGYGITTERGIAFFVVMMFVLGSGFDQDPQLPWVSAILGDQSVTDQNEKVDRLFAGAIDCLKRWWA